MQNHPVKMASANHPVKMASEDRPSPIYRRIEDRRWAEMELRYERSVETKTS